MRALIGCSNLIDRTTQHSTAHNQNSKIKMINQILLSLIRFLVAGKVRFFKVEREGYSWKIDLFIGRK